MPKTDQRGPFEALVVLHLTVTTTWFGIPPELFPLCFTFVRFLPEVLLAWHESQATSNPTYSLYTPLLGILHRDQDMGFDVTGILCYTGSHLRFVSLLVSISSWTRGAGRYRGTSVALLLRLSGLTHGSEIQPPDWLPDFEERCWTPLPFEGPKQKPEILSSRRAVLFIRLSVGIRLVDDGMSTSRTSITIPAITASIRKCTRMFTRVVAYHV
jgi:hypothetical protein